MAKKNLHPTWFKAKVFCEGNFIFEIGSTKEELHIDLWSGNHPFYTGLQKIIDTEGRIEKFEKKYNLNKKSIIKEN